MCVLSVGLIFHHRLLKRCALEGHILVTLEIVTAFSATKQARVRIRVR